MNLTRKSIDDLDSHWAVNGIRGENKERVSRLVSEKLAQRTVGKQFTFNFNESSDDASLLEKTGISYELAAVEGLKELRLTGSQNRDLIQQAMAGSYLAFEIQSLEEIPENVDERLYFVLKLSALAYCGDRWSDLRKWYKDNENAIQVPKNSEAPWDEYLKFRVFDCWVKLFRKDGWNDLSEVSKIIADLRSSQERMENKFFENGSKQEKNIGAVRLVALFHFARSTEVLAQYIQNGDVELPGNGSYDPLPTIDKHFDAAILAADSIGEAQFVIILKFLHATAKIMVLNSLWWVTSKLNSQTSRLVETLTSRNHQPMFELLPPQKSALLEHNLLDPAKTAIVIDLPTSSGKTLLAEFRILQAINQFQNERGWIAYVVPTRALAAQITRRLRQDLGPVGICVEQLTAAVEIDAFEEKLLTEKNEAFDILVATPEKLSLLIKNDRTGNRPLALVVIDEAHNIESKERGMRIEFLLAVIKRDCSKAKFLLMMPNAQEIDSVADWLSNDPDSGKSISLGTTPWKPNERIIGLFSAVADEEKGSKWHLKFETLTATSNVLPLKGEFRVGNSKPIAIPKSKVLIAGKQTGLATQTAAMAKEMSVRGTSIAVGKTIPTVWKMASDAYQGLQLLQRVPEEIKLLQEFLRIELGPDFQLIELLEKGVGVHHSGLSDDVRTLVEWLAETGKLKVLCATTTIAQGLNFPVASVFLQSHKFPRNNVMTPREFWNLAGRAGRIGHDSIGIIGIAAGQRPKEVMEFVSRNTGALVSQLVTQLNEIEKRGELKNLSEVLWRDQWEDFRCYIAHLWAQKKNLDQVLSDTEQFLRQTFGYTTLRNDETCRSKADALLTAAREYAIKLSNMPEGIAELADSTGFSPEGVQKTMHSFSEISPRFTMEDWNSNNLFSSRGRMSQLYEVMLKVPQLNQQLERAGGKGFERTRLANITIDWINGMRVDEIADRYFADPLSDMNGTKLITSTCQAIYRSIVNSGSWGISALSRCAGLNFENMSENQRKNLNLLPAMIYHGVNTEEAVLMRMNSVPRSSAVGLGKLFQSRIRDQRDYSVGTARNFLKSLNDGDWKKVCPEESNINGHEWKRIWQVLSGEGY